MTNRQLVRLLLLVVGVFFLGISFGSRLQRSYLAHSERQTAQCMATVGRWEKAFHQMAQANAENERSIQACLASLRKTTHTLTQTTHTVNGVLCFTCEGTQPMTNTSQEGNK